MDYCEPPETGMKLVAAIGHLHPDYHRQTKGGILTRVGRALRGWSKLLPATTLAPWPWAALCGIASHMMACGRARMAFLTTMAGDVYMRPGAFVELTKENLVPPRPSMG